MLNSVTSIDGIQNDIDSIVNNEEGYISSLYNGVLVGLDVVASYANKINALNNNYVTNIPNDVVFRISSGKCCINHCIYEIEETNISLLDNLTTDLSSALLSTGHLLVSIVAVQAENDIYGLDYNLTYSKIISSSKINLYLIFSENYLNSIEEGTFLVLKEYDIGYISKDIESSLTKNSYSESFSSNELVSPAKFFTSKANIIGSTVSVVGNNTFNLSRDTIRKDTYNYSPFSGIFYFSDNNVLTTYGGTSTSSETITISFSYWEVNLTWDIVEIASAAKAGITDVIHSTNLSSNNNNIHGTTLSEVDSSDYNLVQQINDRGFLTKNLCHLTSERCVLYYDTSISITYFLNDLQHFYPYVTLSLFPYSIEGITVVENGIAHNNVGFIQIGKTLIIPSMRISTSDVFDITKEVGNISVIVYYSVNTDMQLTGNSSTVIVNKANSSVMSTKELSLDTLTKKIQVDSNVDMTLYVTKDSSLNTSPEYVTDLILGESSTNSSSHTLNNPSELLVGLSDSKLKNMLSFNPTITVEEGDSLIPGDYNLYVKILRISPENIRVYNYDQGSSYRSYYRDLFSEGMTLTQTTTDSNNNTYETSIDNTKYRLLNLTNTSGCFVDSSLYDLDSLSCNIPNTISERSDLISFSKSSYAVSYIKYNTLPSSGTKISVSANNITRSVITYLRNDTFFKNNSSDTQTTINHDLYLSMMSRSFKNNEVISALGKYLTITENSSSSSLLFTPSSSLDTANYSYSVTSYSSVGAFGITSTTVNNAKSTTLTMLGEPSPGDYIEISFTNNLASTIKFNFVNKTQGNIVEIESLSDFQQVEEMLISDSFTDDLLKYVSLSWDANNLRIIITSLVADTDFTQSSDNNSVSMTSGKSDTDTSINNVLRDTIVSFKCPSDLLCSNLYALLYAKSSTSSDGDTYTLVNCSSSLKQEANYDGNIYLHAMTKEEVATKLKLICSCSTDIGEILDYLGLTNEVIEKNVSLVPITETGDIPSLSLIISGTDSNDTGITETISFTKNNYLEPLSNYKSEFLRTSNKFNSVTSVSVADNNNIGDATVHILGESTIGSEFRIASGLWNKTHFYPQSLRDERVLLNVNSINNSASSLSSEEAIRDFNNNKESSYLFSDNLVYNNHRCTRNYTSYNKEEIPNYKLNKYVTIQEFDASDVASLISTANNNLTTENKNKTLALIQDEGTYVSQKFFVGYAGESMTITVYTSGNKTRVYLVLYFNYSNTITSKIYNMNNNLNLTIPTDCIESIGQVIITGNATEVLITKTNN